MSAVDIVTFGEALAMFLAMEPGDLITADQYLRGLAGAESQFAIGMARLGFRTGWVSRLGNDSFAPFIRSVLLREGVDLTCVQTDLHHPTGFQFKSRPLHGEVPVVESFRKGSAASRLSVEDFDPAYFRGARHLHVTGIAPALSPSAMHFTQHAMDFMRLSGKGISFDPNLREPLWPSQEVMIKQINPLACKADYLLLSLAEGRLLTGLHAPEDITARYLQFGVKHVVVKLGHQGAYFSSHDGQDGYVCAGAPPADSITTGEGEGFAAGVISALLEQRPLEAAIARGNWIGTLAMHAAGDMTGLPTRQQLERHESEIW
ncbi:sugar kinase [Andreprevotia chitinilytica]|uniref:sugar kinase n=1 Tax=Andreprevotia chitinilytica TaxID=396808 RepID=UPI0005518412|nr:sugar kinase [Andreprevotia chitinilytica]